VTTIPATTSRSDLAVAGSAATRARPRVDGNRWRNEWNFCVCKNSLRVQPSTGCANVPARRLRFPRTPNLYLSFGKVRRPVRAQASIPKSHDVSTRRRSERSDGCGVSPAATKDVSLWGQSYPRVLTRGLLGLRCCADRLVGLPRSPRYLSAFSGEQWLG
jgi:hypothetical protein